MDQRQDKGVRNQLGKPPESESSSQILVKNSDEEWNKQCPG